MRKLIPRMQYQHAVILDDHQLFAELFAGLLNDINKFELITCVSDIAALDKLLKTQKISHFFTDYKMPEINTLSEIRRIKTIYPYIQIIVVSSIANPSLIYQMQKNGAVAFISKSATKNEVNECLETLQLGKNYVSNNLRSAMLDVYMNGGEQLFTSREYEILQHIATGATIEETAEKLHLSKHTIVAHRRNMMAKLDVNSVTALLNKVIEMGVI